MNADPKIDTGDSHTVTALRDDRGDAHSDRLRAIRDLYFGNAHPEPTQPGAAVSGASVDPKCTNAPHPGNDFVIADVLGAAGVDVYLFGGPDMLNAAPRYNVFSGRALCHRNGG